LEFAISPLLGLRFIVFQLDGAVVQAATSVQKEGRNVVLIMLKGADVLLHYY
jgi:hypothetical protein